MAFTAQRTKLNRCRSGSFTGGTEWARPSYDIYPNGGVYGNLSAQAYSANRWSVLSANAAGSVGVSIIYPYRAADVSSSVTGELPHPSILTYLVE